MQPHRNIGQNPRREWRPEAPLALYKPVRLATAVFLDENAKAAQAYLGAKSALLIPKVFARAKYVERRAKRLAEALRMGLAPA